MDWELPDDLAELQSSVRRLARDKVRPRAREIDETGEYPSDLFELFRDAGLLGLCMPPEYGGSAAPGSLGLTIAIEEVAKYSNTAALMLLLTRLPTGPRHDRRHRRAEGRYLPGIAAGTARGAFGLSEPQAGSDVMGMRTRATRDSGGRGWVLNGIKCWMSGDRPGRLVHRLRQDRRRRQPPSRLDHGVHRRASLGRRPARGHRPQDGRARRRHRRAAAGRRVRRRRPRHRAGRRLPAGHAGPELHAARSWPHGASAWPRGRSCTPPSTSRSGRRSARPSPTSRASNGRSPSWPPRSRRPGCSRTGRRGWPTRGGSAKEWAPYLSMAKY